MWTNSRWMLLYHLLSKSTWPYRTKHRRGWVTSPWKTGSRSPPSSSSTWLRSGWETLFLICDVHSHLDGKDWVLRPSATLLWWNYWPENDQKIRLLMTRRHVTRNYGDQINGFCHFQCNSSEHLSLWAFIVRIRSCLFRSRWFYRLGIQSFLKTRSCRILQIERFRWHSYRDFLCLNTHSRVRGGGPMGHTS